MCRDYLLLQERGRPPKVHLQDTVEEMHKFNAIRKLKVALVCLFCLFVSAVCIHFSSLMLAGG